MEDYLWKGKNKPQQARQAKAFEGQSVSRKSPIQFFVAKVPP
jgi:hypothetical protein